MPTKHVKHIVQATSMIEGAGVNVHRTIGTPALRNLDPFIMLDHFGSSDPDQYIAGFPDHPHRGFITLTYILDGHMLHQDSMGNKGDLKAGGIQWMKAASGVIHSEIPQQTKGLMRGFQLWINLPATEKMTDPNYQEFSAAAIPIVEQNDATVRVISGSYGNYKGPIEDPNTNVHYLDVALLPRANFSYELPETMTAFIYPYQGNGKIANTTVPTHTLACLSSDERFEVSATDELRFILVAGRPIGEPIVQYGPFVMSSREEIEQAVNDYHDGTFVRTKARWVSD